MKIKINKCFFAIIMLLFIPALLQAKPAKKTVAIDTSLFVPIGGIKQFISMKGKDKNLPILLILHGGPGRSLIDFSDKFTDKLQNEFIIVNWDQRETGATLKHNKSPGSLSAALLKSDALEMVNYLIRHYHRKKIYLASHSWGSVMGFDIAAKHPELLYAFIPISPVIDANGSAVLTVDSLKKWALAKHNDVAIEELQKIKLPYETKEDLYLAQKWAFIHNEVAEAETEKFKTIFYDWMNIWFETWKENAKNNILFQTVPQLKCPVYFLIGVGDNQTNPTIAASYFKLLKADKKQLFLFEQSGHTIFNTEPEKLQKIILENIKIR